MLHLLSTLGLAAGLATATVDSTELRREDLMAALRTASSRRQRGCHTSRSSEYRSGGRGS